MYEFGLFSTTIPLREVRATHISLRGYSMKEKIEVIDGQEIIVKDDVEIIDGQEIRIKEKSDISDRQRSRPKPKKEKPDRQKNKIQENEEIFDDPELRPKDDVQPSKNVGKIALAMQAISIVPLILFAVIIGMIASHQFQKAMYTEVENNFTTIGKNITKKYQKKFKIII